MDKLLVESWGKHILASNSEEATKYFNIGFKACRHSTSNMTEKIAAKHDYLATMNFSWFNPINKKYRNDITMAPIVAFFNFGFIDPDKTKRAEGCAGSEIALVSISEELASRGYHVYVFFLGNPTHYSIPCSSVQYLPIEMNKESDLGGMGGPGFVRSFEGLVQLGEKRIDHLVLWRQRNDADYVFDNYANKVYLGCHDFCDCKLSCKLEAVLTLSKCHKEHFENKISNTRHIITCNGTAYNPTMKLPKRKIRKCCYASSYARGLDVLVNIWPEIHKVYPDAELHIWYGRETFGVLNEEQMKSIVDKIETQPSIYEHGRVTHKELIDNIASCDFLLYYYTGQSETFSITTATSMQLGTIPIVSKRHALAELMHRQEKSLLNPEEYTQHTTEMLGKDREELDIYRSQLQEDSKEYNWKRATDIWEEAFNHQKIE